MTEKKNPRRVKGAGCNHCGGDEGSPTPNREIPQLETAIHIVKDGAIYRVQVLPPQDLDGSIGRPETYAGAIAARQAAGWLSKATGWPITDLTGRGA